MSDGDCDDSDPEVNPDSDETCDGRDEDCDGVVDEGLPISPEYIEKRVARLREALLWPEPVTLEVYAAIRLFTCSGYGTRRWSGA